MPMEAGQMPWRLGIERYVETRDEFNGSLKDWSTYATVWASRQDISDAEKIAAQEKGAILTTRFQIRWSPTTATVTPRDRLRFEGNLYDITGIKAIGYFEGLEITAAVRLDLTT